MPPASAQSMPSLRLAQVPAAAQQLPSTVFMAPAPSVPSGMPLGVSPGMLAAQCGPPEVNLAFVKNMIYPGEDIFPLLSLSKDVTRTPQAGTLAAQVLQASDYIASQGPKPLSSYGWPFIGAERTTVPNYLFSQDPKHGASGDEAFKPLAPCGEPLMDSSAMAGIFGAAGCLSMAQSLCVDQEHLMQATIKALVSSSSQTQWLLLPFQPPPALPSFQLAAQLEAQPPPLQMIDPVGQAPSADKMSQISEQLSSLAQLRAPSTLPPLQPVAKPAAQPAPAPPKVDPVGQAPSVDTIARVVDPFSKRAQDVVQQLVEKGAENTVLHDVVEKLIAGSCLALLSSGVYASPGTAAITANA